MSGELYKIGEVDIRQWGRYEVLDVDNQTVIKKLVFSPNKRTSLQKHSGRSERWLVIGYDGYAKIGRESKPMYISTGDVIYIEKGQWHQLISGPCGMSIIEVQTGWCSESDIIREEETEKMEVAQ